MPLTDAQVKSLADAVIALLGSDANDDVSARAFHSVELMTSLVQAYTRGAGFAEGEDGHLIIASDLQTVIVLATARLATNPAQSESESESSPLLRSSLAGGLAGSEPVAEVTTEGGPSIPGHEGQSPVIGNHSFGFSGGFHGWTPVELSVLHRYRVRNG